MKIKCRVVEDHGNSIYVQLENASILPAKCNGKLLQEEYLKRPTIGDWAEGSVQPGDWVLLEAIAERENLLQRVGANGSQPQKIGANVHYLWILCSLNEDFNLNRMDRYVNLAREFQAIPVIVLTKFDQCVDFLAKERSAQQRFPEVRVICTSILHQESCKPLEEFSKSAVTIALLGSSGVGKTSLINRLLGREAGVTQSIRETDGKGRHTTTHRSLFRWGEKSWLLDSPGVRSLALVSMAHAPLQENLAMIMASCKFTNCSHGTEPGCAVQAALLEKELSEEAWNNYLRMKRESEHFLAKQNKAFASSRKQKWKKISQGNRARLKAERDFDY